jgi:Fe-Mn family superoxide dismutase
MFGQLLRPELNHNHMSELKAEPLKFQELPGLSAKQLAEHHDVLYAGYVKKVNEIRAALPTADRAGANATWSQLREMKLEEGFALNGVTLHERYFDNLTPNGNQEAGIIQDWIAADFGAFDKWAEEFAALGLASRGWVVLAFDLKDGRLHNYIADMHNQGGIWGAIPLLVLDVYEHAYFLDYATARKKYVETFLKNVDWRVPAALASKFDLNRFRI